MDEVWCDKCNRMKPEKGSRSIYDEEEEMDMTICADCLAGEEDIDTEDYDTDE